jgi:hypothetical protein
MSMSLNKIACAFAALGLLTATAGAATLTNSDHMLHKLTFKPAYGHIQHVTLKAGQKVNINCSKGGELMLGKDSEKCSAKTTKIDIKGGKFVI